MLLSSLLWYVEIGSETLFGGLRILQYHLTGVGPCALHVIQTTPA